MLKSHELILGPFSRFCITSAVDESLLTPFCHPFAVSLGCMLVLLIPDIPDGFNFKTVALCVLL